MEISYDLQAIETGEYRVYFFMALVAGNHSLGFSPRGLETEGVFYDEPVFKLVPEEKTEAFPLIDFCRTQQEINKCIFG